MAKEKTKNQSNAPRVVNRKAKGEYHILEVLECGMELTGTEVKSLRAGQAKIDDAFARIRGGELYLIGANIAPYPQAAPLMQHEPARDRKLLAHKKQIEQIQAHLRQKGQTVVPLAVYFKRGWAKCELGLAVGKKLYDKRQDLKKRQAQREIEREMRKRR